MADSHSPRSADEIRAYLRDQVNGALRRLGMYGRELSLLLLMDALAYAAGVDALWQQEREDLRRRQAFDAVGVSGAMSRALPDGGHDDGAIASVYAEFAHAMGWLDTDREITADEHAHIAQRLDETRDDMTRSDIERECGRPSAILGPSGAAHPKTLIYVGRDLPLLAFHLWNGTSSLASGREFAEPVLLAARIGRRPFPEAFRYTPEGLRRRPSAPEFM